MPKKTKPRRGAQTLVDGLALATALRERPHTTGELIDLFGWSRDKVERILSVLRAAELGLETEERGRERVHSLPHDTFRRSLP